MNFDVLRSFEQGYSVDLNDNIERSKTFQKGHNGRIYAKNGVFSFNSIEGTLLRYNNSKVFKYIGWYAFEDELVLMAKCFKDTDSENQEIEITERNIVGDQFEATADTALNVISLTSEFTDNSTEIENTYKVFVPIPSETDFESKYACSGTSETEVDLSDYYGEDFSVPNFTACEIGSDTIPINNADYNDCFITLRYDENQVLEGGVIWEGQLNWPINGKITCEGVEENQFYKRVYFTDALNVRRVINLKDPQLVNRAGEEFNQVLDNVVLQPEIIAVESGGQLPAMMSQYVCRVISENGQVSPFSPASFLTHVLPEDSAIEFRGGDVSENTGKKVRLKCNFLDPDLASEVECIAIEYEAEGVPTAIRSLGIRPMAAVVEFSHFGNEAEFSDTVTLQELQDRQVTWKYCNDYSSKKNKLIAGGLRNDPIPTNFNNLEYLFPLHGWNAAGETHDCLMNPEPWNYRMIDPTSTDKLVYLNRKVYRSLQSFGPATITFRNTVTDDEVSTVLSDLPIDKYTNITPQVLTWLLAEQNTNVNWSTYFPNLTISDSEGQILLSPTDDLIETDMGDYVIESNNTQFIQDVDNEIQFLPVSVDTSKLVWGAESVGFREGVGVRISYREVLEPLLNKATEVYDGNGTLLDYETPSLETYAMKGEIYRLGFQAYNTTSSEFFVIPLGDIFVPEIGDIRKWIDNNGNGVYSSTKYVNQEVIGDTLYARGIKLHVEVRLSCELQEAVSMYQLMFVERTEEDRTILCQGIAAPLLRVQDNGSEEHRLPDEVRNKWGLPYYGGPTYEWRGLNAYDLHGENDQYNGDEAERRTMVHRGLMYFDSPDLYFQRVSDQFVDTSIVRVVGKLNSDHTPGIIRQHGGVIGQFQGQDINYGDEVYPKFSRKILEDQIEGTNNSENLPRAADEEISDFEFPRTFETHFINVSVFSNFRHYTQDHEVDGAETLERGTQVSGQAFSLSNAVSNNTFTFPSQPWFYGSFQRDWSYDGGNAQATLFKNGVVSPGYRSTFIKTKDDLFTGAFISGGPNQIVTSSEIRLGGENYRVYDTIPVINLFKNNRESVYGGRSEQDYSRNIYIPASRTIPVIKSNNGTQYFDVGLDTYLTLNIRVRNDYGDDDIENVDMNNGGNGQNQGDINTWLRNGAWAYVVVLESQVEAKLPYGYEFYRETGTHSFEVERPEIINSAYFNQNSLRSYIPKPFKFKDDPNQGNVIAVSDVKLAGETYDSWTRFRVNNFYAELEKNLGDVSNLVRHDENIYALQKRQTSLVLIGVDRAIQTEDGGYINVEQGSGTVVDGHRPISKFGTGIRRNAIAHDFGMSFFDETKVEFMNLNKPLYGENALALEYWDRHKDDIVVDAEPFYNHKNKETNIRIRTASGAYYVISYNEALGVFNGEHFHNEEIYPMFVQRNFMSLGAFDEDQQLVNTEEFHEMNVGPMLYIGKKQLKMHLGYNLSANVGQTFILKGIGVVTDMKYVIEEVLFSSNESDERNILGDHEGYWIREGMHRIPSIQETINDEPGGPPRGQNFYVELICSIPDEFTDVDTPDKINILAVNNFLRLSHQ